MVRLAVKLFPTLFIADRETNQKHFQQRMYFQHGHSVVSECNIPHHWLNTLDTHSKSLVNGFKPQGVFDIFQKRNLFLSHMSDSLAWKAGAFCLPRCTRKFHSCQIQAKSYSHFFCRPPMIRYQNPLQHMKCYTWNILNNIRSCIIICQRENQTTKY